MDSNYLTINIDPDEGFFLELNVKVPGVFNEIVPAKMDFSHKASFGPNTPKAYETLITDAIRGDQFAFVRADEIIQSWKIIESIIKEKHPIHTYPKKSTGPEALKKLDTERNILWRA
jgi:glucose-6-phosphate 1-dehydrogenase